ncbi:MAG: hypothetical protein F4Y41_16135 [Gammaproteobacteria bacterium]|nr:hypothetical protein [Gammaproteobacteria bacterium]MYF29421.1 hypothetical protein [Gammaproteobacteria bacterium]
MPNHSTLSDDDIERIVNSPAMADLLRKMLDEKFGEQQHEIENLQRDVKGLSHRMDRMQNGIDNVGRNLTTFAERQETLARNSEKRIERKLDEKFDSLEKRLVAAIDERLGVTR